MVQTKVPYPYEEYSEKSWLLHGPEGKIAYMAKSVTEEKEDGLYTKDDTYWVLKKIEWRMPKEKLEDTLKQLDNRLTELERTVQGLVNAEKARALPEGTVRRNPF